MRTDHPGARTRRHDHVAAFLELCDQHFGERARRFPVAGVPAGLPAAGLQRRYRHLVSAALQELERRKSDRGPHQIDQTGDKQADSHGEIPETGVPVASNHSTRDCTFRIARSISWYKIAML